MRPAWVLWWVDGFHLQTSAKGVSAVSLWYRRQLPETCCISLTFMCFSSLSLPTRCESWSNSDHLSGQTSFDDVFVDYLKPPPPRCLGYHGKECQLKLSTKSQATLTRNRDFSGSYKNHFSSPLVENSLNSTIDVDKNRDSLPYAVKELDIMYNTPPPRPPKPSHLFERRQEEQLWCGHSNCRRPESTTTPRRTSLPGLDNMRTLKGQYWVLTSRHKEKPGPS